MLMAKRCLHLGSKLSPPFRAMRVLVRLDVCVTVVAIDVKVQAILFVWCKPILPLCIAANVGKCHHTQKLWKLTLFVWMQASHASQADGTIINADGSRTLPDGTRVLVGDHI
jgi:hypothetical protein